MICDCPGPGGSYCTHCQTRVDLGVCQRERRLSFVADVARALPGVRLNLVWNDYRHEHLIAVSVGEKHSHTEMIDTDLVSSKDAIETLRKIEKGLA